MKINNRVFKTKNACRKNSRQIYGRRRAEGPVSAGYESYASAHIEILC
jgi:hypothetical protein